MTYEERIAIAMGRSRTAEQDDSVNALVRQHASFVYQVAYSVLRDSHDAEDVAQETFVRVMKHADSLPEIRDQRAWLARIAWRLALTKWSRTRKRRAQEVELLEGFDYPAAVEINSETATENQELIHLMERLTSALPHDLRHTLVLSAIEEMSTREVAGIMKISETTVRTRVHRAKKLLRAKLRSIMGKHYGH